MPGGDLIGSVTDVNRPGLGGTGLRQTHELFLHLEELLTERQQPLVELCLLERFLELALDRGGAAWAGYGFRVAERFLQRLPQAAPGSCELSVILRLEGLVERCADHPPPPWAAREGWNRLVSSGRQAIREAKAEVLARVEPTNAPRSIAKSATSSRAPRLQGEPTDASQSRTGMRPPVDQLTRLDPEEVSSILVPMIAGPRSHVEIDPFFRDIRVAFLVRLSVETRMVVQRGHRSDLTAAGRADPQTLRAWQEVLQLMDQLRLPGPAAARLWYRVHWNEPDAQIGGGSANLGFFLAARSARTRVQAGVAERIPARGLAVTGDLEAGKVVPVNGDTLPLKVRACFFGPVERLVVPREQMDAALQEVRRLERDHPRRQLLITPIDTVQNALRDPALWQTHVRTPGGVLRTLARQVATSRTAMILLALLVLIGLGAAGLEWWQRRPFAADVSLEANTLTIRNRHGHICGRVPEAGVRTTNSGLVLAVADLRGDGTNVVLAIRHRPNRQSNLLWIGDARGRTLWRLDSQSWLPAGDPPALHWWLLSPPDKAATGEPTWIALRRGIQASLSLVEALRGYPPRRTGALRNHGHIEVLARGDPGGDGVSEVYLGGTDNQSGKALLAIVEPALLTLPEGELIMDGIPLITDAANLGRGVRAVLRLPRDDLLPIGRPGAAGMKLRGSQIEVDTISDDAGYGSNVRTVIFVLELRDPAAPRVLSVTIPDGYRSFLLSRPGTAIGPDTFAAEEDRLANLVEHLTPDGWRPVAVGP